MRKLTSFSFFLLCAFTLLSSLWMAKVLAHWHKRLAFQLRTYTYIKSICKKGQHIQYTATAVSFYLLVNHALVEVEKGVMLPKFTYILYSSYRVIMNFYHFLFWLSAYVKRTWADLYNMYMFRQKHYWYTYCTSMCVSQFLRTHWKKWSAVLTWDYVCWNVCWSY